MTTRAGWQEQSDGALMRTQEPRWSEHRQAGHANHTPAMVGALSDEWHPKMQPLMSPQNPQERGQALAYQAAEAERQARLQKSLAQPDAPQTETSHCRVDSFFC